MRNTRRWSRALQQVTDSKQAFAVQSRSRSVSIHTKCIGTGRIGSHLYSLAPLGSSDFQTAAALTFFLVGRVLQPELLCAFSMAADRQQADVELQGASNISSVRKLS